MELTYTWPSTSAMETDARRYRALVESGLFWPSRDPAKPLVQAQGAKQRWPTASLDDAVDAYMARSEPPQQILRRSLGAST